MTAMKFEDQDLPDLDDDYVRLAEQFIPGRHAIFAIVEASFEAIHARLKPGAPLAIVDGVGLSGDPQTELLWRIWKRHAVMKGVPEEVAEKNAENFEKVAIVSVEREEELLTNAGFEHLTSIFRGLAIKGWLAFA